MRRIAYDWYNQTVMSLPNLDRRFALALMAALALSACGTGPTSTGDRSSGDVARASYRLDNDVDCGLPPVDMAPLFDEIALRYNRIAQTGQELTTDDGAGGIALKVCRDGLVAAHAGNNRVVVHEGLARTLTEGASIVSATTDGDERTRLLDELVKRAPAPLALADAPYDLAQAAVAFVVYHELGHIVLGHPTSNLIPTRSSSAENEADLYATGLLGATRFRADGVDLVFTILDRINPDGGGTHPSSRERSLRVSLARAAR